MRSTRLVLATLAVAGGLAAAWPALAGTSTLKGFVGPGFSIRTSSKTVAAGKVKLVVSDKATDHSFHLRGVGVNVKTSIAGIGTKTFTITLKKGATYRFFCDLHPDLHGSFKAT